MRRVGLGTTTGFFFNLSSFLLLLSPSAVAGNMMCVLMSAANYDAQLFRQLLKLTSFSKFGGITQAA